MTQDTLEIGRAERLRAELDEMNSDRATHAARFELVANKENWKLPTTPFVTEIAPEACDVYNAIVFFCGGAEIAETIIDGRSNWRVTSCGYYHYQLRILPLHLRVKIVEETSRQRNADDPR